MPLVETIIICRPTKNSSLYAQMVGRGLRLHKDKDKLNLIDLVCVTGKNKLCTAASLLGLNVVNDNITMNRKWKIKMYKNDH